MDLDNSMMWTGIILLVASSCLVGCCKFAHFVREAEEDWNESAREPNIVKAKGPTEKQIRILNDPQLQNEIFSRFDYVMNQKKVCSDKQSQVGIYY